MQASKALIIVIVVGVIVAFGVFLIFPGTRPDFVKKWFLTARGVTPAQTPRDALEKFSERIKERDYETAVLYCGGDYAAEMRIGAPNGTKLAKAIDDVLHNMETVGIRSDKAKFVLALLAPFPAEMKIKTLDFKEGSDKATADLEFVIDGKVTQNVQFSDNWQVDPKIFMALFPKPLWNGRVELKLEGDGKEKGWKIHMPVSPQLRESVSTLKTSAGNYVRGLENLKYAIKHEAATKADMENQLRKQLEEAK